MPAPSESIAQMEAIVGLCKRRGFVFPSSEIYGGINGFFDYGPLGAELKKNIRDCWWNDMVRRRDDVVGIESSIIMHPRVWEASGHVAGFTDPLVDCKVSKQRFRADQLFFAPVVVGGKTVGYVSALESDRTEAGLQEAAENLKRKQAIQGKLEPVRPRDMTEAQPEEIALIPSPATGEPGSLTPPRAFNMMFETYVGALRDASAVAYLRPETAQGMFANFKNVVDTGRVKLPFGIAQIGKSFRNEITPRNFIFRSREFEQMEMEYFIHEDADWAKAHREWIDWCKNWLHSIGLPASHLSEYDHPKEKLAFYSKGTTDIMFRYPFGVQELWGIAARGNYDLSQHAKASGKPLEYFDEATKKKFTPHVIEPAVGVDRIFLAVLCAGYAEEEVKDEKGNVEKRTVLRLSPRIAPVKVAVLPLLKNKPELVARAEALHARLKRRYAVFYDEGGAIGRRYRRQDEIGTPWCVTIDFETIEKDGSFTLRERDSMQQRRIQEPELFALLDEQVTYVVTPYAQARALIDAAHAGDPSRARDGRPAELVYAERMEGWVGRLVPAAPPILRLAARCQHLERWSVPRATFPEGKAGYFAWRKSLYAKQSARARELLLAGGVSAAEAAEAEAWVAKSGLKTNPGSQALEDAACLVFLENEIGAFAAQHADYSRGKFVDIVRKTWRKMSAPAQALARGIALPPGLDAIVAEAID